MRNKCILLFVVILIILSVILSSSNNTMQSKIAEPTIQDAGQIYLYGETHAIEKILDKELELWNEHYHNQDMRHLFVELPYYTAEFLNIWMQLDSDDILDELYNDWYGTYMYNPEVKEFYMMIKSQYPQTIFHGTDIGHHYFSTGDRFLKYLEGYNLEESEQYLLTKEAIEQGRYYYNYNDNVYRENMMADNFTREFDKVGGESIMGIYGSAHTGLDQMDYVTNSVPSMVNQLKQIYGDSISSVNLSSMVKDIAPYKEDIIKVGEKDYKALYFGKEDFTGNLKQYVTREFWRVDNAYEEFADFPKNQNLLPYNDYPMNLEDGQVFVIDYTKTDGSVIRKYYCSNGYVWDNVLFTEEFIVE